MGEGYVIFELQKLKGHNEINQHFWRVMKFLASKFGEKERIPNDGKIAANLPVYITEHNDKAVIFNTPSI